MSGVSEMVKVRMRGVVVVVVSGIEWSEWS